MQMLKQYMTNLNQFVVTLAMRSLFNSMDGPNVNWKVFRLMQEDVEKQTGKKLLNIGSCGLHVIHNSFRDGCSGAQWEVETFLSSVR